MMTLNLNFLPQESRRRLSEIAWLAWFENVLRCAALAMIVFDVFLFLIYFVLSEQADMLSKRSADLSLNYSFYGQAVGEINKKVNIINQAGGNYALLTPRFWTLAESLPPDIQLKNVSLNAGSDQTLTLNGVAKDRDALLAYKRKLEAIPWVTKTALPTTQLLQKTDINFVIEVNIKPPTVEEYQPAAKK